MPKGVCERALSDCFDLAAQFNPCHLCCSLLHTEALSVPHDHASVHNIDKACCAVAWCIVLCCAMVFIISFPQAGKQIIVLCETGGSLENKSGTKFGKDQPGGLADAVPEGRSAACV